jgi:hypothetical protein
MIENSSKLWLGQKQEKLWNRSIKTWDSTPIKQSANKAKYTGQDKNFTVAEVILVSFNLEAQHGNIVIRNILCVTNLLL